MQVKSSRITLLWVLYDIAQVVPTMARGECTHCKLRRWWYCQTVNHVLHKSMQELYVGVEDLITQTNNYEEMGHREPHPAHMGKHAGAQKRGVVASCQLHEPFCWGSKMFQSRKFRASLRGFSRQLQSMLHGAISLCFFDEKWAACAPGWDKLLAVASASDNSSFTIQVGRKVCFLIQENQHNVCFSPCWDEHRAFLDL